MMRLRALMFVLVVLCLSVTTALAQDSNLSAGAIATSIDASASIYGLPSGNGAVSPAEQALGSAAAQSIQTFSTEVETFAQSSPENGATIDAVNTNVAQGKLDPIADAISNAVAQYGMTPDQIAIHNAVTYGYGSNYGVDDDTGDSEAESLPVEDPSIPDHVEIDNPYGWSPDAVAVHNAVRMYTGENPNASGQTVKNAVRDGINHAVDQSSVPHKALVRKHIQRLIEQEAPSTNLPINGYWRVKPFSVSSSGHCIQDNGDNGGPDGAIATDDADPGRPLCGYANAPELPYLVWNGDDLPYLPGTGSLYGPDPSVSFELIRDGSGASVSSVKVTTTREYRVVSPTEIRVHLLMQEDGGCSLSADYELELVTPDDSVCPRDAALSTLEPTPTPPPETQGPFRVGLPFYNNEADCDESNRPPTFGDVFLKAQAGGALLVDYGSGQQMMFADGWNNYSYDSGNQNGARLSFNLTRFGGGGSLFWSKSNSDGKLCVASFDLVDPAQAAATPTPAPESASDGLGTTAGEAGASDAVGFVLPTGHFAVTWAEYPGVACPADLTPKLPKFAEADISTAGGAYQLVGAGVTYPLQNQGGNYMYVQTGGDQASSLMSFTGYDADGNVTGSFIYSTADGKLCMNQLTLAKA
jgi:hypothetical protein